MFDCAVNWPVKVKVPGAVVSAVVCSPSASRLTLSVVPMCLLKVMRAAVMAPFGPHSRPPLTVTTCNTGFSLRRSYTCCCKLMAWPADSCKLHLLLPRREGVEAYTSNFPSRVSVNIISPFFKLFLFPSLLYLSQKLTVHLETRA